MLTKFKNKILRLLYGSIYKPGHFYSPIPDLKEINRHKDHIYIEKQSSEININTKGQLELLLRCKQFIEDIPYKKEISSFAPRYSYDNNYFVQGDANVLYFMMRIFEPQKIIEIGSGYSSAIMLDTNELHFENKMKLTFIEPHPENRLNRLIKPADNADIISKIVQSVDKNEFLKLEKNDILFIDSSHVSKFGSDVNYLFFEIFPLLKSGVIIHVHDICYPFEYPLDWITEGRFWNEAYILKAFLMYNNAYEILCFNHYLFNYQKQWLETNISILSNNHGGSFWMQKK